MIAFMATHITPEGAKQLTAGARETVLSETFPGVDAAMGDHVGAEIADRVEELLRRIEILVGLASRRAHEGGFDTPDSRT
jgi:hypothetical protein